MNATPEIKDSSENNSDENLQSMQKNDKSAAANVVSTDASRRSLKNCWRWWIAKWKVVLGGFLVLVAVLIVASLISPSFRNNLLARIVQQDITLRIVDDGSGQPVAQALVNIGAKTVMANAQGVASLTAIPMGQYTLSVTKAGYKQLSEPFSIPNSSQSTVHIAAVGQIDISNVTANSQLTGTSSGTINGSSVVFSTSSLHTSNATIVDSGGTPVLLRGTQIQSELNINWTDGSKVASVLNPAVFAAIHSWNMNVLRIPFGAYNYQKPGYMAMLDKVVQEANQAGLYVILGNFEDQQAGGGNSVLDQQGLTMWKYVAAHYKDNPMVLFDLINEPSYADWNTWLNGGNGTVGMNEAIAAIRSTGAQQVIVVQPGDSGGGKSGWATYPGGITDNNVMYSLHFYEQLAKGNTSSWNQEWGPLLNKKPLYFGEWAMLPNPNHPVFCQGVTSATADQVTLAFLNYMDSIHANWTAWSFTTGHLIQDETSLAPTNFQTGAPWSCPNGVGAGMGQDVKDFLATSSPPSPGSGSGSGSGQTGGSTCSGVSKQNGTITFSRLSVDSSGHIVDQTGCIVHLIGLNEGDFFTGAAGASTSYQQERYTFLKNSINQNIDRINVQARWWDDDVWVPNANMHFRAWLEQYIQMAEAAGNYVELDVGPQYFEPPCGKGVSLCPAQSQGSRDYQADPACAHASRTCPEAKEISGGDESIPLRALTDLGNLYANDPAILMDVWNEPLDSNPLNLSPQEYFADMNKRIDTLRASAPAMPVIVYSYQIMNEMATGQVQPYQQKNLIIDMHDYSPNLAQSSLLPQITYFQQQGWGAILNEFGGTTASDTALQTITGLVNQTHMGALYFEAGNLYDTTGKTPPPYTLNANGLLAQKYFEQMLPYVFTTPPQQLPCNPTGRVKNADGSYTFSPLYVNRKGVLVDSKTCQVYLLGAQGRQPQPMGSASDVYVITDTSQFSYLDRYVTTAPMNLLRVPILVDDWQNNASMPNAGNIPYREFVKRYVKAIEDHGLYVELDKYPSKGNPQQDSAALTSMAKTFAGDPAVIFDVRNEGSYAYEQNSSDPHKAVYDDDVAWLNAVDAGNPNALKVVYMLDMKQMQAGTFPFYKNHNLVIDWHLYSGYLGVPPKRLSPDTGVAQCNEPNRGSNGQPTYAADLAAGSWFQQMIAYARSQPNAADFIINEMGGCEADTAYMDAMTNFTLQTKTAGMSYFYPTNWFWLDAPANQENGNGVRTRQAYSTIFTSKPTISPTPQSTGVDNFLNALLSIL